MRIEEFVQLAGEEIVDAKYNIDELVDMAWGREIHLDLDLNGEPVEGNDVNDQPKPIVKFPQACEYAHLLSNFVVEHPSEFSIIDLMNKKPFMGKLSKMSISSINKHHQKTKNSYFHTLWYGEDVIIFISTLWDIVTKCLQQNVLSYLCIFIVYTTWCFTLR